MKRFIICTLLIAVFGLFNNAQAQLRISELAWGLSAGGAHGANMGGDEWGMQYRGFIQSSLVSPMLIGQFGFGYAGLSAPGTYDAETGMADIRLLFSPFRLPNLNPYLFAGFGVSKDLGNSGSALLAMIPMGAGVQTRITDGVMLDINGGYNLSLSDKMDGINRTNTSLNDLTNQKQDGYYGFTIGLAFSLGFTKYDAEKRDLSNAEELRIRNEGKKDLANAEARRVQDSTNAAAKATNVKQANAALAQHVKDSTNAAAELVRVKAANLALAQHVKDSTESDARRVKAAADAEALRLAELKSRDTLIVLIKGKTIVLRGVNFEFNKSTLTKDSETILWRTYNAMVANPNVRVVITGHTDNVGSQKTNQSLSLKRAQAVKNWLVSKGTSSSRMRTVGRGQNEPLASNDTDEGRSENRRMEFFVQ